MGEHVIAGGIVALVFLTIMEIVLGIDNIVFIAVASGKLPEKQQPGARRLGLILALIMRVGLLLGLSVVMSLDKWVLFEFSWLGIATEWLEAHEEINAINCRDIVLLGGGLFLIWKSVHEIHKQMEGKEEGRKTSGNASFTSVLTEIALFDIIFSLDSVITAVGMVQAEGENYWFGIGIMVTAIVIAIGVMLVFAEPVSKFVSAHPTVKMLALSFLILIGVMLVAESMGTPIEKGYIYFAMAFALIVEMLNLQVRRIRKKGEASLE